MKIIFDKSRIMEGIDIQDKTGCWLWKNGRDSDGYGILHVHRKQYKAHRYSYECFVSRIPFGFLVCVS